jgi:hypothetical protein
MTTTAILDPAQTVFIVAPAPTGGILAPIMNPRIAAARISHHGDSIDSGHSCHDAIWQTSGIRWTFATDIGLL